MCFHPPTVNDTARSYCSPEGEISIFRRWRCIFFPESNKSQPRCFMFPPVASVLAADTSSFLSLDGVMKETIRIHMEFKSLNLNTRKRLHKFVKTFIHYSPGAHFPLQLISHLGCAKFRLRRRVSCDIVASKRFCFAQELTTKLSSCCAVKSQHREHYHTETKLSIGYLSQRG